MHWHCAKEMLDVLGNMKIIITHTQSKKCNPVLEKLCCFLYSYIPAQEKQPDFKLYMRIKIINLMVMIILKI